MRVLACGGRGYGNVRRVFAVPAEQASGEYEQLRRMKGMKKMRLKWCYRCRMWVTEDQLTAYGYDQRTHTWVRYMMLRHWH